MPLIHPRTMLRKQGLTSVLHYKLNDNAANSTIVNSGPTGASDNGAYVSTVGGTDAYTSYHDYPGVINSCLYFAHGTGGSLKNYVDGGATSGLLPADMTFSCWFRTGSSTASQILAGWNTYYFIVISPFDASNWLVGFYRRVSTGNYQVYKIPKNFFDAWTHLVIQLEDTTTSDTSIANMKVFVDGVYYNSTYKYAGATSGATNSFARFSLCDSLTAAGVPTAVYPYKGYLDDVRIFSGLIRQDQVSRLYSGGLGTEGAITH